MSADGLGADEQCLGDLSVGEAPTGLSGHAELAGGEALNPGQAFAAGPGADNAEFLAGPSRERLCPAPGRQVPRLPEGFTRTGTLAATGQRRAILGERAGEFQRRG